VDDNSLQKVSEGEVEFVKRIGIGGQGEVWKVIYNGKPAAAKSVYGFQDSEMASNFLKEIKLLSSLKNKYIIQFKAVMITDDQSKIWLITELMHSDLKSILKTGQLNLKQKLRIAKDISAAMEFLHSVKPRPVLHRDLKPSNILINRDCRAKVTDFGISKVMPMTQQTAATVRVGTVAYMSPELMLGGKYNEKADVYSFGILLAEILLGKDPFDHLKYENDWQLMKQFEKKETKPQISEDCPPKLRDLVEQCIARDHTERPTFVEIHRILKKLFLSVRND